MALDQNSPLPLYYQLKQILAGQIDGGTWQPGDMIPTEHQLQELYDVSRTTVRQAMHELELEGKVTRYRGRGTFVARPKIQHNPAERPTLSDGLMAQGITPGWRLLAAEWVPAPKAIQHALELKNVAEVFCLRRLRLEGDDPIGIHMAYVAPQFVSEIDEDSFVEGGSLRYLRTVSAMQDSTADRVIEAMAATEEEADLLGIEREAPLLVIRRIVRRANGVPVECFRGAYRGDRFEYHINDMRAVTKINE